ncbi:hypothetical protein [Candidatus Uabimicrobium amorphum]|uniref:Uncharacterized protein n=1 Tax=Uabimicrobium amorphum TaxID=2596890 RepID=A0A5S9F5C0_UABAM|nr:hypothetical protein [Candidatus Uabimicrobium amorphum]BBM86676.1 hypothetical protein UABAM_05062 [Candidatus Uabimicrobium amorphum]
MANDQTSPFLYLDNVSKKETSSNQVFQLLAPQNCSKPLQKTESNQVFQLLVPQTKINDTLQKAESSNQIFQLLETTQQLQAYSTNTIQKAQTASFQIYLPGSGDDIWRSGLEHIDWSDQMGGSGSDPAYYTFATIAGYYLMVSGPGASKAEGGYGGLSDTGSNSIRNNIKFVLNYANVLLNADEYISKISIVCHSRNAVAGCTIAVKLRELYPQIAISLVAFDPVPGPGNGEFEVIKLPRDIESTVVYSIASGYPVGFTPSEVYNAKRYIISTQDHGGGIENGYNDPYTNRNLRMIDINRLPSGCYTNRNQAGNLRQIYSLDAAMSFCKAMQEGRIGIYKKVAATMLLPLPLSMLVISDSISVIPDIPDLPNRRYVIGKVSREFFEVD